MAQKTLYQRIQQLKKWDAAYAKGEPLVSDPEYDKERDAVKKLAPKHEYFRLLSSRDAFGEKVKLPSPMMSLDKMRPSDVIEWLPVDGEYLITPKLDGLAGKLKYVKGKFVKAFTRGDGTIGRDVTSTAQHVNGVIPGSLPEKETCEINGEFIIHRSVFEELKRKLAGVTVNGKPIKTYKAARNFVVGMLNTKDPNPELLSYVTFIVYSVNAEKPFKHKLDQLNYASRLGFISITNCGRWNNETYKAYQSKTIPKFPGQSIMPSVGQFHYSQKDITEKLTSFLLQTWRKSVDIDQDGLVIEVADLAKCKKLGADETPNYAKAIKPEILDHEYFDVPIKEVEWAISGRGLYKVTLVLAKPAVFNGVEITRCSGFNAKAIKEAGGLGKGSIVRIIRSGEVIPRWIKTIKNVPAELPTHCVHCKTKLKWVTNAKTGETGADLWCDNSNCVGFQTERVHHFFQKFKVDKLGPGILQKLIAKGYNTVPRILRVPEEELAKIEGLGLKSAKTIKTNLTKKLEKVSLAAIMSASFMFADERSGLGERRAKAIIACVGEKALLDGPIDEKLRRKLVLEVDGIADTLADIVIENLPAFRLFYRELPIAKLDKQKAGSGPIACWSGYRSAEEEAKWIKLGGEVGSMTKKTVVLFTSEPGSAKTKKAKSYGIRIVDKKDAFTFLANYK